MAEPLVELYESLRSETDLDQLIRDKRTEDVHFEMKRKKKPETGALSDSDAKHFSKALSGFANSDGGILLWGLGTNTLEQASELCPIVDPRAFIQALKSSLVNSTQPFVDDVRLEVIDSATSGSGYVKCLIPPSEKSPHRAMLADREYYKRSTEGFYKLEHWDLEDMFGRRPIPRLALSLVVRGTDSTASSGETTYHGLAIPMITNEGRGSAKAAYIAITIEGTVYAFASGGLQGRNTTEHAGFERTKTEVERHQIFTAGTVVIHPELSFGVTGIRVWVQAGSKLNFVLPPDLQIRYEMSAENTRPSRGGIALTGREIAQALLPKAYSSYFDESTGTTESHPSS